MITSLKPNQVFVFGANERYLHGAGAARQALQWGAVHGKGGHQGQTYALPTKDCDIKTLPLEDIAIHIRHFVEYARAHPELEFLMTPIGTGLAGYSLDEIRPVWETALRESGGNPGNIVENELGL